MYDLSHTSPTDPLTVVAERLQTEGTGAFLSESLADNRPTVKMWGLSSATDESNVGY
ncbi:hypothetical protein T265_15235 [Opisthorchis viverrini]|uniref:Uncharacterized protein n=1 Tax=Opisthorchis viverrini TaxID=6198 RepID=A0A074ZCB9_OPIVI|nr:hypothetical protein T265_15235 [Opisthorchis viverrini]KER20850.1 hypothetical protein T265_15235 [Opisthorchis viverrini]